MTLVNPLQYPLVIAIAAIVLVIGTRAFYYPKALMIVVAVAIAIVGSYLQESRNAQNTPLQREITKLKQRSIKITEQLNS